MIFSEMNRIKSPVTSKKGVCKGLRSYRSFIKTTINNNFTAGYETKQADTSSKYLPVFYFSFIYLKSLITQSLLNTSLLFS